MEWINEYIQWSAWKEDTVAETKCIAQQNEDYLEITYTLLDAACLFDFSSSNNTICLKISKAYFEKYTTPFELVVAQQDICCNTQSKLHELLNCNLQGFARSVYLESIVLYLLYQVQKNNLVFQLNCDTCSFINKPLELEKIQKAKEFILVNLDQSITIPALANYVGTNQCYLKKGFKEVFGQTIFEFVQENKMVKAKYLLQQNKLSLQEISAIVGYASLSSFSQTYKNYYGISPSIEKKQISNS